MIAQDTDIGPEFYGQKTVLLSKSGFGKSHTARVLIEEGLKQKVCFIIIDPQDAYLNLPNFDYVNAQDVKKVADFAKLLAYTNKCVVVRMKKLSVEDQNIFLHTFLTEYRKHQMKGIKCLVLEESHKYCPEGETTASKGVVRAAFQEDRSSGTGFIAITQRPQRLDKTCLSQADNIAAGRVTSKRDCDAVAQYIDNVEDIEKIKTLERGEFYLNGFGVDTPKIVKIRLSESQHSGDSPKNLLTEDTTTYNKLIYRVAKRGTQKMDGAVADVVKHSLPFTHDGKTLAIRGIQFGLGSAVAGLVGTMAGRYVKSPIPYVSTRTLASAVTTGALYAGHKVIKNETAKDILFYGASGSAAFTAGSLLYDVLAAFKISIPSWAHMAIGSATQASPVTVERSPNAAQGVQPLELTPEF